MSLFDGVKTASNAAKDGDFVRGQKRACLPSDIYNLVFDYAYIEKSKRGAFGVAMKFKVHDQEDRTLTTREWFTTAEDKGCLTYYMDNGEEKNLPGFALVDQMTHLLLGKSITECKTEKRTINLYNREKRTEVPTEVDMLVELVGKGVSACVLHQIQDKTKHNPQTGKYDPTGETFEMNAFDKFLSPKDRKTWGETENNTPADFQQSWLDRWKGNVDDRSTGTAATGGTTGLPAATGAAPTPTGAQAPPAGEKLFGG